MAQLERGLGRTARVATGAALLAFAGVSAAPAASAASSCAQAVVPRQTSDFGPLALSVARFRPALGTLQEVTVARALTSDQVSRVESRDARAQGMKLRSSVRMNLASPAFLGELPPLATVSEAVVQVEAFDGSVDYAGASGRDGLVATAPAASSSASATDPGTLAGFTGDVTFTVQADGTGEFLGPGNADYLISTFAGASVQVCYRYAAAPPPTTDPRPPTTVQLGRPSEPAAPPLAAAPPTTALARTGGGSHDGLAATGYALAALGGIVLLWAGLRRHHR